MNKKNYLLVLAIALLGTTGCGRDTSPSDAQVAAASSKTSIATATSGRPLRPAVVTSGGACAGAMEALASCAHAKTCDANISMYLPATNRSQLIAMEGDLSYSEDAFDRYCIDVCKARDSRVDSAAFHQDVCGAQAAAPANGEPEDGRASRTEPVARALSLRGQMEVGTAGVPLTRVVQKFGQPRTKSPTPHECGSAFNEGDIQEYDYADFSIETDGKTAIVRSMKLGNGNRILLSTGQSVERLSEAVFREAYGLRPFFTDTYRTGISPRGDLESAYDFHFEGGQLHRIEYWIGC